MPTNKQGKYFNSTQRMMAAERNEGGEKKRPAPMMEPDGDEGSEPSRVHTIHDHGDGTFHSISADGERTEHPHVGHAAAHFMAQHGEGGPHDDMDLEALGDQLKQFFDEEAGENY